MSVILIFLDGCGVGASSKSNPFWNRDLNYLRFHNDREAPANTVIKAIDPLLGVEGHPQSATGQTTLFTGHNVPAMLGKHTGSFPNREMRRIIKERSILKSLRETGTEAFFLNAYPGYSEYFSDKHIKLNDDGELIFSDEFPTIFKRKISVTTCLMLASGQFPFNEDDLAAERTLYQYYDNTPLIKRGADLPERSPEEAGKIISGAAPAEGFLLYEYFQTDIYGHRKSFKEQYELISRLDRLISSLADNLDTEKDTLIITSDHGNLEDSSHRTHTLNPVPLLVYGREREKIAGSIDNIADLYHVIVDYFKNQ